jgi:ribonuclease-3
VAAGGLACAPTIGPVPPPPAAPIRMTRGDALAALERRIAHRFSDRTRLVRALTHASYAAEHPPCEHQLTLAFLGDAVLALVVAERLVQAEPGATVGRLTTRRAELVADGTLARWASALELGALLRLGRGAEQTGGRETASMLATALEALLGALYEEAGLPAVRRIVGELAGW